MLVMCMNDRDGYLRQEVVCIQLLTMLQWISTLGKVQPPSKQDVLLIKLTCNVSVMIPFVILRSRLKWGDVWQRKDDGKYILSGANKYLGAVSQHPSKCVKILLGQCDKHYCQASEASILQVLLQISGHVLGITSCNQPHILLQYVYH